MNIADFLLARIAEDEARIRYIPLPDEASDQGWNWLTFHECDLCGQFMYAGTE